MRHLLLDGVALITALFTVLFVLDQINDDDDSDKTSPRSVF